MDYSTLLLIFLMAAAAFLELFMVPVQDRIHPKKWNELAPRERYGSVLKLLIIVTAAAAVTITVFK